MGLHSTYDLAANCGNFFNSGGSGNQPPLSNAVVNISFILYFEYCSAVDFPHTPAQPAVYFDRILSFTP